MRLISINKLALLSAWLMLAASALAQSAAHHDVVIKNATIMTVTHGTIKNGSVYVKDGKIAAVGETVSAPANVIVIDAGGKYLTPGIVDSHSHIALDDDVNEATSPVTPQMMMKDAFDYQDKAIYRALAGGVTTLAQIVELMSRFGRENLNAASCPAGAGVFRTCRRLPKEST